MNHMSSRQPSPFHSAKSRLWLTAICASLTIGTAICQSSAIASTANLSAQNQPTHATKQNPAPAVIRAIRRAVQQQFGVSKIVIVNATEQEWPDGCLGVPRGQEACTMATVPGWRLEVSDNLQTWFYRSDRTGNILRLEAQNSTTLPPAVAKKLIQRVARETHSRSTKLRITEVKDRVYGDCLGIYRPNRPCTKIGIPGWQAIVTSPTQSYVYHLTENADRIVQNKAASGAKRKINVSFGKFDEIAPIAANEIFQSSSSGDLTGRMVRTVLTDDGKITRYQSSPTARFAPVVLKTLSSNQLNAFKKTLEESGFINLNGLSYLTAAALADYPTTTYQGQSVTTQFIDLEKQSLPRSLQKVLARWDALVRTAN
jgi:hypothetical protein